MSGQICLDCNEVPSITLQPYGQGKMATYNCQCGESYDTNIEEERV